MVLATRPEPTALTGASSGFADDDLPAVFELLSRLATAIHATVGPDCEVVVHDLRHPDRSVIAISGDLTNRRVGAPVPDPELLPDAVDKFTEDDIGRRAITPTGRELLASTTWVRDERGRIVGAMCVNVDRSGLEHARDLIDRHLGPIDSPAATMSSFASSVEELTRGAVAALTGRGHPRRLRPEQRIELVRRLDEQGVFAIRGAAEAVASELGVSRSSVYGDLRVARRKEEPGVEV